MNSSDSILVQIEVSEHILSLAWFARLMFSLQNELVDDVVDFSISQEVVAWLREKIVLCENGVEQEHDGFYQERMMTAIVEFAGIQSDRKQLQQLNSDIQSIMDDATKQHIGHWKSPNTNLHDNAVEQRAYGLKMGRILEKVEEYRSKTRLLDFKIAKVTQLLLPRQS